jgi:hypothetical protein
VPEGGEVVRVDKYTVNFVSNKLQNIKAEQSTEKFCVEQALDRLWELHGEYFCLEKRTQIIAITWVHCPLKSISAACVAPQIMLGYLVQPRVRSHYHHGRHEMRDCKYATELTPASPFPHRFDSLKKKKTWRH